MQQKMAASQQIAALNQAMATIETDISNPMMFDQTSMRAKQQERLEQGIDGHECKNWKSVYTTYFDKNLSIKEGRRIQKDLCLDNPNVHLLQFACEALGLKSLAEPLRKHPRDFFNRGRVKVMIINDKTGETVNNDIGTCKRKLLIRIAQKFPEAKEKYDTILTQQKETVEQRKKELKMMQGQAEDEGEQKDQAPKDEGAKKKKKKNKK